MLLSNLKTCYLKKIIVVLFLFSTLLGVSQINLDSLWSIWNDSKNADTLRVRSLAEIISNGHSFSTKDSAYKLAKIQFDLKDSIQSIDYLADAFNKRGVFYADNGNPEIAIRYYNQSLQLRRKIKNLDGIALELHMIGNIFAYYYKADEHQKHYNKALEYYNRSLKIYEEIGNADGYMETIKGIASIYATQKEYAKAIGLYFRIIDSWEKKKNYTVVAKAKDGIGTIYFNQADYTLALKYFLEGYELRKINGIKDGMENSLNLVGISYYWLGDYKSAMQFYQQCYQLRKEIGDNDLICNSKLNIGLDYMKLGDLREAENWLKETLLISKGNCLYQSWCLTYLSLIYLDQNQNKKALDYSRTARNYSVACGLERETMDAAQALYRSYKAIGKNDSALFAYELHIFLHDKLYKQESKKELTSIELRHENENQLLLEKAAHEKRLAVEKEEKEKQKIVLFFVLVSLLLVLFFAGFIFRSLRVTRKQKAVIVEQKEIVEHQKHLVEEHQKEMVDSITYAKRIQYTLLANKQLLESNLPEHFVLFKPKDIVSGDFYWATEKSWQSTVNKEEKIKRFYIAACDSTGHGVPGAFMSLLNISFLNEAVNEKNILEPHEILNHVRKRLIENMDGGQDGMDCILIKIETQTSNIQHPKSTITYAAANNSPAIIKNGNLISLGADKMPVGKGERAAPFTLRTIEVDKGDTLYLYTDGYADQFGGPKGKKFKYKQLDELLVSISNLPAGEQSEILNQRFDDWKAWPDPEGGVRNLEQVDDMLVIGIKI